MIGDILEIIADTATSTKSIGSIPNPTRKITVNYSIDAVKNAIKAFPDRSKKLVKKTYNLQEAEDIISYYMFAATEFLSMGVFVDVNLTDINENRTEIAVEVRRSVGSFDRTQEISEAGRHINRVLTGIGKMLELSTTVKPAPTPPPQPKQPVVEVKPTPPPQPKAVVKSEPKPKKIKVKKVKVEKPKKIKVKKVKVEKPKVVTQVIEKPKRVKKEEVMKVAKKTWSQRRAEKKAYKLKVREIVRKAVENATIRPTVQT